MTPLEQKKADAYWDSLEEVKDDPNSMPLRYLMRGKPIPKGEEFISKQAVKEAVERMKKTELSKKQADCQKCKVSCLYRDSDDDQDWCSCLCHKDPMDSVITTHNKALDDLINKLK